MPITSKKISRLEKEAILRSKDSEYRREQSAHLLTNSNEDEETFENDRRKRYDIMRQTRQIQREIDHQVGTIDRLNERRQQELKKKHTPIPQTGTTRTYLSSSSSSSASSSVTDRANRSGGATENYTSTKRTSSSKLH